MIKLILILLLSSVAIANEQCPILTEDQTIGRYMRAGLRGYLRATGVNFINFDNWIIVEPKASKSLLNQHAAKIYRLYGREILITDNIYLMAIPAKFDVYLWPRDKDNIEAIIGGK